MFQCHFKLNSQPLSDFIVSGQKFPAFSGFGPEVNKPAAACHAGAGPIPPGQYWILDREKGGLLSRLRAKFNTDKSCWFGLYRNDGILDDRMWCDGVERGNFRLHPRGPRGISLGCIAVDNPAEFVRLAAILRSVQPEIIGENKIPAVGLLTVS